MNIQKNITGGPGGNTGIVEIELQQRAQENRVNDGEYRQDKKQQGTKKTRELKHTEEA